MVAGGREDHRSGGPQEVVFDPKTCTLLLRLRTPFAARALDFDPRRRGFTPSPEPHITVIGSRNAARVRARLDAMSGNERTRTLACVVELAQRTDWSFTSTDDVFQLRRQDADEIRESIVQRIELPGMESLYRALNGLLGLDVEPQVPHVTLYTRGTKDNGRRGIGVYSADELAALTVRRL